MKKHLFSQNWFFTFLAALAIATTISACYEGLPECGDAGTGLLEDELMNTITCTPTGLILPETPALVTDPLTGKIFNPYKFTQAVRDSVHGKVKGWQVALGYYGQTMTLDGGGIARELNKQCYGLYMNSCVRVNIASVTKNLTGAAALKLMEANNLTLDSLVAPHLPSDWEKGLNFDKITFRQLFNHNAGLDTANQNLSWAGLKTLVKTGVKYPNLADPGDFVYFNANYALFRIIIPILWKKLPNCPNDVKMMDIDDTDTKKIYERYIKDFLLAPADVYNAKIDDDGNYDDRAYHYQFKNSPNGKTYGDWRSVAGGGGWLMSTADLAKYFSTIMTNNTVFSANNRTLMLNNFVGILNTATVTGGTAYGHGGDLGKKINGVWYFDASTSLVTFPFDIQVALSVNSSELGNSNTLFTILRNAYEAAWE